ncbi:hypothetical protein BH23PLA1_BH23PLA1_15400 [soil metagenome]
MSRNSRLQETLNRLAAAERQFLAEEFLAPVVRGGEVFVRIEGIACRLRLHPADFEGWGVFLPYSHTEAEWIRPATLAERRKYLERLPRLGLILVESLGGAWWAVPAQSGDSRFRIEGALPVSLAEDVQRFETIQGRFDGARALFESLDDRRDPALAESLRQSLEQMIDPANLDRPGLSREERDAYALVFRTRQEAIEASQRRRRERMEDEHRRRSEGRVGEALARAGATLQGVTERADGYRVTFEVDGHRHVSFLGRNDLTVHSAGFCLSGLDEEFDLQSLVGVIREGYRDRELY